MATSSLQPKTDLSRLQSRLKRLQDERSSWLPTWKEIAEIFSPRSGYWAISGGTREQNRGRRKDQKVVNNTTLMAALDCASGFHVGLSSPSKPWFQNRVREELMRLGHVRNWLDALMIEQRAALSASNVYNALWHLYYERAVFGTCVARISTNMRDRNGRFTLALGDIIGLTPFTVGTYCLAMDDRGRVDTVYREMDMTVGQIMARWGETGDPSQSVKDMFRRGSLDQTVRIVEVIEPRAARDIDSRFANGRPWRISYFEYGCREDQILFESGADSKPFICSHWQTFGDDAYGAGPGFVAIGDGNGLQHSEVNKARVIAYKGNPPLQVPAALKHGNADLLPGGISYFDGSSAHSGIRTAFDVELDINHLTSDIERQEFRILRAFFADTFRAILNDSRSGTTKFEVELRHQEQLQAIGPVVESAETDVLVPVVDSVTDALFEHDRERVAAGLEPRLPEAPSELDDEEVTPEFIGALAQAVRTANAGRIDRILGVATALAAVVPEAMDKIDTDEAMEEYGRANVVPAKIVRDQGTVSQIRRARAEAQAAAAQAEAAKSATEAELNAARAGAISGNTDVAGALATANALA